MHGFLVTKELLGAFGEFDEKISAALMGMEFHQRLKQLGVAVRKDAFTVLEYEFPSFSKSFDLRFFHHQWNEQHAREDLRHLREKWGVLVPEAKCLAWLQKKKQLLHKKPAGRPSAAWDMASLNLDFPKLDFKKFLRILDRA